MRDIDKQIFGLAIPAVVTNITVPLLGMADLAIVGHMGNAVYIGAVAVGSMMFNVIYWIFGFLRMGTSGLTAQALGANDHRQVRHLLRQSITAALIIATLMIVCQRAIFHATTLIMQPDDTVSATVDTYFSICVWGAPAVMGLYSLTGWFIGMQNTRIPMYVSIAQNITNLLVSITLVFGFGLRIEGVALGTMIAQWTGFGMALMWLKRSLAKVEVCDSDKPGMKWHHGMLRFFAVNRDIFLRTLFLVMVNLFFTSFGSRQGTLMLSANTLLLTLFTLTSFFLDGLAYAAEALGGKYCGAADRKTFSTLTRRLFLWGIIVAIVFTLVFAFGGKPLLHLLTSEHDVISTALPYLPWAVAIPIAGVTAFLLDGLFIGLTATRPMLWSTALAAIVFFTLYFTLAPTLHNHALWLALIAYLAMRGIVEMLMLRFSPSVFKSFMQ